LDEAERCREQRRRDSHHAEGVIDGTGIR
jgi:hypothetical protein